MCRLAALLLALGLLPLLAGAQPGTSPPSSQPVLTDAYGDSLPPGAVARLGTVRLVHPGGVTALAFAPDGKAVATGGPDRTVRLWDVNTGRELRRLTGHKETVCALVYSPDGKTLVSGSQEGGIFLWDATTGHNVRKLFHLQHLLENLAYSADGKHLVSVGDRIAALWEMPVGRFVRPLQYDGRQMRCAAFSLNGKELAFAGHANEILIADVATGQRIREFPVECNGPTFLIRLAYAGSALVAANGRGRVHLHDAATGKVIRTIQRAAFNRGACLAVSPDKKLLAYGGDGDEARLYVLDLGTGQKRWTKQGPHTHTPGGGAFSPDGKLLATADATGRVHLWHADSGLPLHSFGGHVGPVVRVCVSGDGKTVVTAGEDGTVRLWDRATGKERRRPSTGWGTLDYLAVTPDVTALAASGPNCPPCLFDLTRDVKDRYDAVRALHAKARFVALSPDGTRYAVQPGAGVTLYDRPSGRELARYGSSLPYATAVISPDNRLLAAVLAERDVDVLDSRTGQVVMRSSEGAAEVRRALAFSPDSKRLASASDKRGIEVWDLARKTRTRFPAEKQEPCHTVAFSADGKLLAWDGPDGTVRLGEPATGKELRRLRGHEAPVTGVAFTADGRFLASSSRDGTALVWDVPGLLRRGQPAPKDDVARQPQPAPPPKDLYGDKLPDGGIARLGTVRWRLDGDAQVLGFTPDGNGLVVNPNGQKPGPLRVLDIPSGKELARLQGADYPSGRFSAGQSAAMSGKLMVIGYGTRLDLWEMPAGRLLRQIQGVPHTNVLALSPDGKTVATAGGGAEQGKTHPIRLYAVASGKLLAALDGHRTPVQGLVFAADGKRLLSSSAEIRWGKQGGGVDVIPCAIRVWDLATQKTIAQYPNADNSIVFAPDGRTWAQQGRDNRLHLVAAADGKELAQIGIQGSTFVFTPDGKALATAGRDQPVRLWDARTGQELRRLEGQLGSGYPTVFFAPDGKTLACVNQSNWSAPGGTVRLWEVPTGKEIRPYAVHQDEVLCVAHAPDGKTVASGGKDGSLFLWQAATGKPLHRLGDHEGGAWAVAFARDGRLLASGGADGAVRLWRVADGKELRRIEGPGGGVVALTFSADGKTLWACSARGKLQGWDVAGGAGPGRLELKAESLHTAGFSPDGELLAYVAGYRDEFSGSAVVRVCRVSSGKELLVLDLLGQKRGDNQRGGQFAALHCWGLAFSGDSRLLATSESIQTQGLRTILGNHTVRVWELATGKQVLQLADLATPTKRLALSPDGRLLAHAHGQMRGWGHGDELAFLVRDLSTGETLHQIVNREGAVTCLHTGATLRPLRGHVGGVTHAAFAPGGKTLLTAGGDGTLMAWTVAPFLPGPGPRPATVTAKELQALWGRLADSDAALAYQTIGRLEWAPELAVPFLKERLKPAPAADPRRLVRLIAELEDKRFAVRQKAFTELAAYAEQAEEALRQALPLQRSLEAQRRLQQLLERLDKIGLPPERLRALRAVTLLERIGTPEARAVLETLAAGAPTRLTREARAALERGVR